MSATAEVEVVRSTAAAETSIVSWLFEKAAGAAVGSAAGFGLDYVMALVGIKDPPSAVMSRLTDIQNGITAIMAGIKQVSKQLDDLALLLSVKVDEIKTAIKESVIESAVTDIESHYGKGKQLRDGAGSAIVSLSDAVQARIAAPSAVIDVKTFSDNIIGSWDIHGKIVKIANTATNGSVTQKALLKGWTDYLLEKNKGRVVDKALTIYLTLESYFQQLLAAQFKGITLVSSAKCWDKTEAEAKPLAEAYLQEVAGYLVPEVDLFVQCADEIIMAMYTDLQYFYSPGPTQASDSIRTISRRANLIRAIVYAAVNKTSVANGGICGSLFGRNVEKEVVESRTFTPAGYAASAGTVIGPLDAHGNVPIEWGASTDNKYATLRDKSQSAFQAFHYYWPFSKPLPEAGKPIDASFDGGLTPQWYDLNTLEKLNQPTADQPKLLVADFCDMRFMRGAIFANPADADAAFVSTPADKGTTNNNQNRIGYRNDELHGIHAMRADNEFNRRLTQGSLEAHMNYYQPQGEPIGFTLEFPLFRYTGDEHTLHLVTYQQQQSETMMRLELVDDVRPDDHYEVSNMLMSPRGKIWLVRQHEGVKTEIPLYSTDDRGLSLWGQGSYTKLEESRPFEADVLLHATGGKEDLYSLVLELCVINRLHEDTIDPVHGRHAKGRITYNIRGLRLKWK